MFTEEQIQAMQEELDRGAPPDETKADRFARAAAIIERRMAEGSREKLQSAR